MFQKNRIFTVFLILSIYVFGTVLSFTGDFIQHIQVVRHQNQIEKIATATTLEFSLTEWKKLNDKKEIKFHSHFYDVVSIRITTNKIIAKVVKDSLENEIRVTLSQICKNQKIPYSDKKKSNTISKHFVSKDKFYTYYTNVIQLEKKSNFKFKANLKEISFIYLPIKPPC